MEEEINAERFDREFDPATFDADAHTHMVEEGVAPVQPDPFQILNMVIQHLGIEIANKSIEVATTQAKVGLVLAAYEQLHIDTWVRQVVHEPRMTDGQPIKIAGPIGIPPSQHEALSRFLAAVEGLR